MKKFVRISSLNRETDKSPAELIKIAEDNYSAYITEAAEKVTASGKPIILLSGPSGSGKTSAALRIERLLREQGKAVHTLSMDNYFLPVTEENRKELPRDEDGNIDLESPQRLDIALFSEHLKKLAACEEFNMPVFDFATQLRSASVPVKRSKGEIIIIEGIHALNPLVTGDTHKFAVCMYVSVRTRLKAESGELMHPRQIRLMRRLCRDSLFRKRKYADIFGMFKSVSRGEDLYITPYKNRADFSIDTFMAYEPLVYREIILSSLLACGDDGRTTGFSEYGQIVKFLSMLRGIDSSLVPAASMIREFIGGSELSY